MQTIVQWKLWRLGLSVAIGSLLVAPGLSQTAAQEAAGVEVVTEEQAVAEVIVTPAGLIAVEAIRVQTEELPIDAEGYEIPPVVSAKDILPAATLSGPHFRVDENVSTRGLANLYTLTSDFGSFTAHGNDMLRIREQEIAALAKMAEMKSSKEFADAALKAGESPFKGVGNLILNPVDTITGVPKGVFRYVTRLGELVRSDRSAYEDSKAKELIGFGSAKRRVAHQLGVDVYSSNKILQKDLNSVAWASYAGGMTVVVGTMGIGAASQVAMLAVRGASTINQMNQVLRDQSSEDIRNRDRQSLEAMRVGKTDTEAFLNQHWLSPRHELVITESLAGMKGVLNREEYIELALTAESEEDAFFFQRTAELLRAYYDQQATLEEIQVIHEIFPVAYAANKTLVVPLVVDYGVWSQQALGLVEAIKAAPKRREVEKTQLWITGQLSLRAKNEIEKLGWEVHERAFTKLYGQP